MTELPKYVPDKDELKRVLPIRYVCARLGITFDETEHAICPFHDDDRPSLYLFTHDDGETHFSCQPCGVSGDIYTMLMKYYHCGFKEALQHAIDLYDELPEDWSPPAPQVKKRLTMQDWTSYINEGWERAIQQPGYMAARVGYASVHQPELAAKWDSFIYKAWRWGIGAEGEILIPHFDAAGTLVGCKTRKPDSSKGSLSGSSYAYGLYGAWRGKRNKFALITEGESDCIYASCQVAREKLEVDVFSLPGGASHFEEKWLDDLKNYEGVFIAFDPDKAGVDATWVWVNAMSLRGIPHKICFLPLGRDLRDAQPTIKYLLDTARMPLQAPADLIGEPGLGYAREIKDGGIRKITPWYLEPTAQLRSSNEDDGGYDIKVYYLGTVTHDTIKLSDLSTPRDMTRWANKRGMLFTGRDDDLKRIAEHLAWRGSVVPEVYLTDQVGLQNPPDSYQFAGPSVVFPDGYLGKMPWRYVSSARTSDARGKTYLPTEGRFEWQWLEQFLNLSTTDVTHPLLAWLVAAARRPEVEQFPILFIGGSSGAGKSTLAKLALRLMGSKIAVDLGATTPFILTKTLSTTTSIPIFIDEWTRLSRKDTREAFQGAIPITYVGGFAERGQADLSSAVYKLTSPVIVAGEDQFMLDREIERMIAISPSRQKQNVTALKQIANHPIERFGQLLHSWLTTSPTLPEFSIAESNRVEYNKQILRVGWGTLHAFLYEASQYEEVIALPDKPDLSGLEMVLQEESENVYDQALLLGASMLDQDRNPVVWADPSGKGTWVRFQNLVGLVQSRQIDLALPGGSRAMKSYFEERHELELGQAVTPPNSFTTLRAWLIKGYNLPASEDVRGSGWLPS